MKTEKEFVISKKAYEKELARLQIELVRMQEWVRATGHRLVVIFEGRDAAGKGGAIQRVVEATNPRVVQVVALPKPTDRQKTQWYFQRYAENLPAAGEIKLFDRSWYNRAGVERVMGFCSDAEYHAFLKDCPQFEELLIRSGIHLLKYWFSVSDEEQERRFHARLDNPAKRWKLSPMDLESRNRWADYTRARDAMFAATDLDASPWYVVEADVKRHARLNFIHHLLAQVDYYDVYSEPLALAPRPEMEGPERPPIESLRHVPEHHLTLR